jgi:phosphoribosylcarboxyaminoimidazole (NCAIR) mutase
MQSGNETAAILELVQGMADVSMAVFHRNPYLHFTVTDESDGSNFDVMVTRADAIDIFPGYRASATALARVAQRLGERFGALTIGDALPIERVSLDDLVASEG